MRGEKSAAVESFKRCALFFSRCVQYIQDTCTKKRRVLTEAVLDYGGEQHKKSLRGYVEASVEHTLYHVRSQGWAQIRPSYLVSCTVDGFQEENRRVLQGFSWVMTRPAGQVRSFPNSLAPSSGRVWRHFERSRVGTGPVRRCSNFTGRAGSP